MPPEEAGYTYAVEPTATNRLLANEEESIYGHWAKRLAILRKSNNSSSSLICNIPH
jgi:hypothetical protein